MTQVETWLGAGAVLAELHLPDGPDHAGSATGVVLCPPLAQEHILAYRSYRLTAERLAAAGLASIRFDYPGHGDSTTAARRTSFAEGPRLAAEALRAAGCTRIVYLGLSIGALIAQEAARADPDAAGLVLWDPARSGRVWLRRARTLYATSVQDAVHSQAESGLVDVVGGSFDAETVEAILALVSDAPADRLPVLVAARRGSPEPAPAGAERREVDGHEQLLDVSSVLARIPSSSIDSVVDWLRTRFGPEAGAGVPLRLPIPEPIVTFTSGEAAPGRVPVELLEEIRWIGPDRLFAIETRPRDARPDTPAVLLQTGSTEHRIGPARYQVLQARALAAAGIRAIRLDRRGTGESSPVSPDEPNLLFAREWIEDNANAVSWLGLPAERVAVCGQCVGGWLAVVTAPAQARTAIAVGMGTYRIGALAPGIMREHGEELQHAAPSGSSPAIGWLKRILPYPAMLLLGRLKRAEMVEALVGPPVREGSDIVLLMSPEDEHVFTEKFGERAAARLSRARGRLTTVRYESGDHALFEARLRARVLDDVTVHAQRILGGFVETAPKPERSPAR